ncbi:MAG: glycosyltransferase family 2 protein [Bacilli bacterium]|nr:glycosyltransferase family 2 protein [Bacilli bacterium]
MEKDLVSIIVPCYNASRFLNDVFLSIKNQTYQNIEAIFVDDGSTDETGKMLDNFARSYSKAKVVHKVNGGLSSARNAGLAIAKGKYIYFMDSDDIIHPETIEYCYKLITGYNADLVNFNLKHISQEYRYSNISWNYSKKYEILSNPDQIYTKFIVDINGGRAAWSKFFSHDLLKTVPGYPKVFNEKCFYGEDILLSTYLFRICKIVVYSKAKLYLYRRVKSSMMHASFSEKELSLFMFEENVKALDPTIYPTAVKYVPSMICLSAMDIVYRLRNSDYQNPEVVNEIYHKYRDNLKYLPRLSRLPLSYRFGTLVTLPVMYLIIRKKLKG